jgi:hypothetical protein
MNAGKDSRRNERRPMSRSNSYRKGIGRSLEINWPSVRECLPALPLPFLLLAQLASGCQRASDTSNMHRAEQSNGVIATPAELSLRIIYWSKTTPLEVPEHDFEKRALMHCLAQEKWIEGPPPKYKGDSEIWQIDLVRVTGEKLTLLGVQRFDGHLIFAEDRSLHCQSKCLNAVLKHLMERNASKWQSKLDRIYFRDGDYGQQQKASKGDAAGDQKPKGDASH